jgi:hypothetical protein
MAQKTAGKGILDKKLLEAASKGDNKKIRKLLGTGANIEARVAGENLSTFLAAFASSVEGNKVGTKTAAKLLADNLLEGIPFNANKLADVEAKRNLIGFLASAMSAKREDFLVDVIPALSEAKDKMKGKLSTSDAVSRFRFIVTQNEYNRTGGDIEKVERMFHMQKQEGNRFLAAFASSVEGNKVGTKTAAELLADGILRDIPFSANNADDVAAKGKLIGQLMSAISAKREDFLMDTIPALNDVRDRIRKLSHMPSVSKAVSMYTSVL